MPHDAITFKPTTASYLPLASLHPAAKLLACFCFAICISLVSQHITAFLACVVALGLAIVAHLPLPALIKKLWPINFFFIFLWLFLPLHFSAGALSFSSSGLELAALVTLKGNAIALMMLILLGASSVSEICRGLLKLHLPEKLVTLLLLTHTNIAFMKASYVTISAAAKLRGFVSARTLASYKTSAYLTAMLLVRSWQRAQRVSHAMRLRGFCGQYPLLELPLSIPYHNGKLLLGVISLLSVALLVMDHFFSFPIGGI